MTQPKIYGLIGNPVKHSLSPAMHNAAFRALKIKARYKLFAKKSNEVANFLSSLKKKNIWGLNVTIPYKEKVMPYLSSVSSPAKTIGAVNTIVVTKDGKLKGENTDYSGFNRHIKELKLKPKKAAIIGAGGAARAICFALAKNKTEEIFIYDIDSYKSISLAKRFRDIFPECKFIPVSSIEGLEIKKKDLLVNATPVGMQKEDTCLISHSMLDPRLFVYDLIYNPSQTQLLKVAKESGCRYANGLDMLLYQGVESFNHWMKVKKAPVEVMRKTLQEAIKK